MFLAIFRAMVVGVRFRRLGGKEVRSMTLVRFEWKGCLVQRAQL